MYERIIAEAIGTPWAISPRMLPIIRDILQFRAQGGRLSAEEIQTRVNAAPTRTAAPSSATVAVVPIWGVIAHRSFEASSGMTSTDEIGGMFRRAVAAPDADTILLDISSPGGTVTGVSELADEIFAARKKKYIVALTNGEQSSAAYFLGSQAHEVVSIPTGMTGSIGVWMLHEDWAKWLEHEGIALTPISAGKYKLELAPWSPLSEEAKTFLQGQVDDAYRDFTAAVARGRGRKVADVRAGFGEGRVLTADQALADGLIDAIETVPALLSRLAAGRRFDGSARTALAFEPPERPAVSGAVASSADLDLIDADLALRERSA
jgi:signal peptide peptidase SppA